ncbi:MAG: hypothetical protein M1812_000490 [Candelaria pacifica]|nr:MAG: hypothetical protein M1812_000490 [Candelaria pacifica]
MDAHVGLSQVYSINKEGVIDGFNSGIGELHKSPLVGCPTCGSSLKEVKRYAIIHKVKNATNMLDRMVAKFGRKVSMWHREILEREELLRARFVWFCKEISPGPGAVKSNQELVRERGSWYMEIQSKIYSFLDDVVRPFEKDMSDIASLIEAHPFRRPVFAFALRLELLFRRCRLETLLEARRMADFLHRQDDPTSHLQTMAQGLLSTTEEQSVQNVDRITIAIKECRNRQLPALEAEFTLTQLAFHVVGKKNGVDITFDTSKSYERALHLCGKFPDTAGKFFRNFRLAKRSLDGLDPPKQMYAAEPIEHWKKWSRHVTGHLTFCDHHHPYSSATFEDCPECGRETSSVLAPEPVDYEKYLDKHAFLKAMERKAGASA